MMIHFMFSHDGKVEDPTDTSAPNNACGHGEIIITWQDLYYRTMKCKACNHSWIELGTYIGPRL